jgi:hypothetical protein
VNKYLPNVWRGIILSVASCRHCDHGAHTKSVDLAPVSAGPGLPHISDLYCLLIHFFISGCCDVLFSWLIAYTHTVPWQDFVDVCDIHQMET